MKTWLYISTTVFVLMALASLMPVMMSPMIFDAGTSTVKELFFYLVISFPINCIVSSVLSWRYYRNGNLRRSRMMTSLPFIHMTALVIVGSLW